jgi:hypothetical protein
LFGEIALKRRTDIVGIQLHPLATAVVVHHDLYEIGILRELSQVLFRAVDRIEGSVVRDVPTEWNRRLGRFYRIPLEREPYSELEGPRRFPLRVTDNLSVRGISHIRSRLSEARMISEVKHLSSHLDSCLPWVQTTYGDADPHCGGRRRAGWRET